MGVEELTPPSGAIQTKQLPGGVISVSPMFARLAGTRSFRRLRSINQLLFLDVLYPGSGYRRELHSYRAYTYCVDLLGRLTRVPRFRFLFDHRLARQALALALLHDINHFPLLHVFQEVDPDYLTQLDLLDLFCDGEATQDSPSIYEILSDIGLSREQFRDVLLLKHADLVNNDYAPGLQIAKSLIDSGADIDKLAYLTDDSLHTGVAYGRGIDVTRLMASATVAEVPAACPGKSGWHLAFSEGGMSAVESLVLARYWMFRTVYWHWVSRAVMAMLLHVIRKLYVEGKADLEDFVRETMWQPEEFVLRYLDDKFVSRFPGQHSITKDILRSPDTIYQRLLNLQGVSSNHVEVSLYQGLTNLDGAKLEACRLALTDRLQEYLQPARIEVSEHDVL